MYFADDVGTPIFKALEAPSEAGKLLWIFLLAFIVSFSLLMTILLLLRRRLIKKDKR